MGLSRLFGVCAALLFASSVSAAEIIDLGPSDYRNWGTGSNSHTGSGIRSSTGQTVRLPPLNGNLNVTRNAVIPYGSISNGLRQFVRINPASVAASAAVTGLFLAVDWAWDELTQEWVKYELQCPVGQVCAIDGDTGVGAGLCSGPGGIFSGPGEVKTVTATSAFTMGGVRYPAGTVVSLWMAYDDPDNRVNTIGNCIDKPDGGRWPTQQGYFPYLTGEVILSPGELEEIPTPVDFGELTAYLPSADPDQVGRAGNDAMRRQGGPLSGFQDQTITGPSSVSGSETTTTSTDPVTGDTVVTTSQTTTNITYGDTTITTTNTTTTNTYTNGQHTGSETVTETPGELPVTDGGGAPPAGEWPGFCDWAGIVCDWIGWTQEEPPAEPELPQVIDDDFYEEKDISFGAKSCPPDYEITIPFLNTVVAVPMQPFCDFAGIIYYMVMAASYIIAAYITVGVVRNG